MRLSASRVAALLRGPALCLGLWCGSLAAAEAPAVLPTLDDAAAPAGDDGAVPGITPSLVVSRMVARLVAGIEASADHCGRSSPQQPEHRAVAAEVERFREAVPAARSVSIEVRDCYWDGMVLGGERIVVSARLARATPAQRFFVIAHEWAHLSAQHHARFAGLVTQMLEQGESPRAVSRALERGAGAPLSRRNESEADALAVQTMLRAGVDPEEAARFLEDAARSDGRELDTHPSLRSRAAAIRALIAPRLAGGY